MLGSLTCPGVLSVGSGPWWNSRCSFPEWRSNTNCLSFPGTLKTDTGSGGKKVFV